MTREQEKSIVKHIVDGDKSYYKILIETYHCGLLRLAASFVGDDNAEDVMQDVWISVSKALPQFQGDASLKTWLYRIVTNTAISKLRQDKAKPLALASELASQSDRFSDKDFDANGFWTKLPTQWELSTPERIIESEELSKLLQQQIKQLPSLQQSVLIMHDIDGITSKEICNILEITASNVRVLLHRARTRLYAAIEKYQRSVL